MAKLDAMYPMKASDFPPRKYSVHDRKQAAAIRRHLQQKRRRVAACEWMCTYADHEPDFADAVTVILSSQRNELRVWTYDGEFRTVWRRADGSAIPMALA